MNLENVTEEEVASLHDWADSNAPLTAEQKMMCIALERLGCNALPTEIAALCDTSTDNVLELKQGIYGILVDANTGRFWIR